MVISDVLSQIDSEISRLQQVRQLLAGDGAAKRPAKKTIRKKRKMSKAARERIAAAQRARWAKQRKAA